MSDSDDTLTAEDVKAMIERQLEAHGIINKDSHVYRQAHAAANNVASVLFAEVQYLRILLERKDGSDV